MKILHVVPGLAERGNGIAVAVRLIAEGQRKAGNEARMVETREFVANVQPSICNLQPLSAYAEIWVHSNWLLMTLRACWKVSHARIPLVRMPHANLDPVRYHYHGWKKRLVSIPERYLYRRTARVVVTCEAERKWCEDWGVTCPIEVIDIKQFFDLGKKSGVENRCGEKGEKLHVLYLGRIHPLKGVEYLERAVAEINNSIGSTYSARQEIELRIVSDHYGEKLECDWAWCDVLCLPTLSENFGLVVAEALERGKRVITTDGAPAWEPPKAEIEGGRKEVEQWRNRLVYLRGYRDGGDRRRIELLKDALRQYVY